MKIHETTFMKVLHTMDQSQCDGAGGRWGFTEPTPTLIVIKVKITTFI
jgi:hypothetical protein